GLVVRRAGFAGDVRRDDVALVLADVGERPDAVDVADRPQPLAGPQVLVDLDAARVGLDADRLQADALHPRPPPGRDEQPVAPLLAAVAEFEHELVAVAPGAAGVHADHQLDPVL